MKNFLPKTSIYLNIVLFFALILVSLSFLNSVLAAGHPVKHTLKKRYNKHSLIALKRSVSSSTNSSNSGETTEHSVPQSSPTPSKPQIIEPLPTLTDNLSSAQWWQETVKSQVQATNNNQYASCLFGDSISSGLGNTLGAKTFNFAVGGMSTVSLAEQLQILNSAHVKCSEAVIAIGTNDAMYNISNEQFVQNLQANIAGVKAMGATQVILIPAFYSTVAASHNPNVAGTIARVDEINDLIRQVGKTENVAISSEGIQPLYEGEALKENLTIDGVHLNEDGKKVYRQALLKVLQSSSS